MAAIVDDRLLARWEESRRQQEEARRFLARQRFRDPRGEKQALEQVVRTLADLEQELLERAARRTARQPSGDGGTA